MRLEYHVEPFSSVELPNEQIREIFNKQSQMGPHSFSSIKAKLTEIWVYIYGEIYNVKDPFRATLFGIKDIATILCVTVNTTKYA